MWDNSIILQNWLELKINTSSWTSFFNARHISKSSQHLTIAHLSVNTVKEFRLNTASRNLLSSPLSLKILSPKIISILDNRRQTTIRNHFFRYSKEARNSVKIVTVDISGSYIPLIKKLQANIVLDHFHIVQHMNRVLIQTRIHIMKQYDKKSLEYRALKYYWQLIQKNSRKLSLNAFYSRTFRETLTPKQCLSKLFNLVPELKGYDGLYQLLLFYLQEKNTEHFFDLIQEVLSQLNHTFKTALNTTMRYKNYVTNAIELPYSNAKLEATNKPIKDIKHINHIKHKAFSFRNFDNFKKRIYLALNITKEKTNLVSSRV